MILTLGLLLGTLGPSTPNTRQVPLFNGIDRTVELSAPVGAGDVLYFKIRSDGSMTDACVIDAGSLRVSVQNNVLVGQGCTVEVLGQGNLSIPVDNEFRAVKVTSNVNDRVRYLGSLGGSSNFFNGSLIDIDSEGLSFPMSFGNLEGGIIPNTKDDGRNKYSFTGTDDYLKVPQITLEPGDQLKFKYIAPNDYTNGGTKSCYFFDRASSSDPSFRLQVAIDGTFERPTSSVYAEIDGVEITGSTVAPTDGLEHEIVVTVVGSDDVSIKALGRRELDLLANVNFPVYDIKVLKLSSENGQAYTGSPTGDFTFNDPSYTLSRPDSGSGGQLIYTVPNGYYEVDLEVISGSNVSLRNGTAPVVNPVPVGRAAHKLEVTNGGIRVNNASFPDTCEVIVHSVKAMSPELSLEYKVDDGSGDRVISTGPEATEERYRYWFTRDNPSSRLRIPPITLSQGDEIGFKYIAPTEIPSSGIYTFFDTVERTRLRFLSGVFNIGSIELYVDGERVFQSATPSLDGKEHHVRAVVEQETTLEYFNSDSSGNSRGNLPIYDIEIKKLGLDGTEPNLITNGTFDTDLTGWELSNGGWFQSNGRAVLVGDGSVQSLSQTNVFTIGNKYEITFDVYSTSNPIGFQDSTGTIVASGTQGTVTTEWIADTTNLKFKREGGTVTGWIDNVMIKELSLQTERSYPVNSGSGTEVTDTVSGANGTLLNSQESSWKLSKSTDGTLVSHKPLAWTRAEGGNGIGKNFNVTAWETIEL